MMREGAWISPKNWHWVQEHASWVQREGNSRLLDLSEEVQAQLSVIPWDFNGPGRRAILLVAMNSGLIRMRGHGAFVTFEFTIPMATVIQSVKPFMDQNFGPMTWCKFNELGSTRHFLGIYYQDLCEAIEKETLSDLLAKARQAPNI